MLQIAHLAEYSHSPHWWVALSGGVDSTVLLHSLVALSQQHPDWPPISAVHINHHLQQQADAWQRDCEQLCASLHIDCEVMHAQGQPAKGDSVEAWARAQRYRLLAESIKPGEVVFSGHHQNDQIETLLLQLSRGAGPYGLAGMPEKKILGQGVLVRPFLSLSRDAIEHYAKTHQLSWIEDPSNQEQRFDRNFIRHELVPMMQSRWPGITKTLQRSANWMADSTELLDDLAKGDLPLVHSTQRHCLSIAGLNQLSQSRCQHVLRYWLRSRDMPVPTQLQMQQIMQQVLSDNAQTQPLVQWTHQGRHVSARRYRDDLYMSMAALPVRTHQDDCDWDLSEALQIAPEISVKAADLFTGDFMSQHQCVHVRWQPGGAKVKKLFQTHSVPPWWRYLVPVCFVDRRFIKAVNYRPLLTALFSLP